MHNYKELVTNFIVENFLFGEGEKLNGDTDFFQSGIIDSTGIIELVGYLESSLRITVKDEELTFKNFSTLNNIFAYLQTKIKLHPN
jgi:acyl carrier protein